MQQNGSLVRSARWLAAPLALAIASTGLAQIDPLTARADVKDAERFAAAFLRAGGTPDAATLQRDYLDGAGRGVAIFTPHRIKTAVNLARAVRANRARYAYAIETCLPLIPSLDAELRATYLGYRGLLPNRPLPAIYVVFGATNSGGTAQPDAQVIGLEVMCSPGTTRQEFKNAMRAIYAHETAHSLQASAPDSVARDKLMYLAISEGTADFLATLVTGRSPNLEREAFGRAREAELWGRFQRDRALLRNKSWEEIEETPALNAALRRWFWNADAAPPGLPAEMGYWVGMQIAAASVDAAGDKRAAIEALLACPDPVALATASGYSGGSNAQSRIAKD